MKKDDESFFLEDAWIMLRKHFTEFGGLLDQIDHGRNMHLSLGDQPEEYQELEEIKRALTRIHHSWEGIDALPKWQVCLLWSVVPRLEGMLSRATNPLMIHILHAKILTWIGIALNDLDRERDPEYMIIHHITVHAKALKGFSTEMRFGRIDSIAFEELVQAINVLDSIWKGRSTIPRIAAWLFLLVPLKDWDAKVYKGEQIKQLEGMKQHLYSLIGECFCEI